MRQKKRQLIVACLVLYASSGFAGAVRTSDGELVRWRGDEPITVEQAERSSSAVKGFGAGGVLGALIAGPAGLVVGGAAGALVGHDMGQGQMLRQSELQVQALQQQLAKQSQQLQQQNQEQQHLLNSLDKARLCLRQQLRDFAKVYRLHIHFRTESTDLETRYVEQLEALSDFLRTYPGVDVLIASHADRRGTTAFNDRLSQQRAERVVALLRQRGIDASRLVIRAEGEAQAEYPGRDTEGAALDRRVTLQLRPGRV